jgi:hypothetical protein
VKNEEHKTFRPHLPSALVVALISPLATCTTSIGSILSFPGSRLLKVLKGIFSIYWSNRQCHDVLLNNQRHLHQKMQIKEFNEFEEDVSSLDDPFASLTPDELASTSMGEPSTSLAHGDDDSAKEYNEEAIEDDE